MNVTANASDNVGVAGVQFLVDGANAGVEDATPPYALAWDTRTVSNGAHTLTARARDAAGNSTLSAPVPVNVANASSFQNEILATGLNLPTSMLFLPDGRMLVAELPGTIKVLSPPYTSVSPTPFLQLTNVGNDGYAGLQQGIFSIALDPNFATNHYYYVFYTTRTPNRDRLSRFTADATLTTTNPNTEFVLYQDPQDANTEHHGGAIVFGNDGKLYFTTGDHFQGAPSQDLTSPRGKIHRINPDGTVPTDNPFYDGNGPNVDSIWALGLRNPYRAYYDAPTGRLYVGDVGGNDPSTAKEEVDLGAAGRQLRLAELRRDVRQPGCTEPALLVSAQRPRRFDHRRLRLPRNAVPEQLPGQLLLRRLRAELDQAPDLRRERQRHRRLQLRAARRLARRPLRRHRLPHGRARRRALLHRSRLLATPAAPSASARSAGSAISSGNQAPIAVASANPTAGPAPLAVSFSSAGSSDPEGQTADVRVDVRRRRHVDGGQPDATRTRSPASTRRGSRSRTARTRRSRRRSRSASAARRRRRSCRPATARFFVAGDVISYQRRRDRPGRRHAARAAHSPGRSTSSTKATSTPARQSPASRAARSRSRPPATTSAATPATGSRSRSPTRPV